MARNRLQEYQRKRDFTRTPEPKANGTRRRTKKLRYCIHKHLASHLHYDLRLEHDGVLLSWAVPKGPSLSPRQPRLAVATEDHPLDYRTFEGVIPSGYGAGIVLLWDEGWWRPAPESEDVDAALDNGELLFEIHGEKLSGGWRLIRTHRKDTRDGRAWLLIKRRDEHAGRADVTKASPDSVRTGRGFGDVLSEQRPEDVEDWLEEPPAKGGEAGRLLKQAMRDAGLRK